MTYKITYNIRVGKKRFYHLTLFENETPTITHHHLLIRAPNLDYQTRQNTLQTSLLQSIIFK